MTINTLKNDTLAGITAAIVALPLALAFGVASGAGAITGLYGAIILGFFASLFGGTKTQISGPTGPMTVVTASAIVTFGTDFQSVFFLIFFSGLIQISFGIIKIGKWIKYIPYPVISGFMTGIGIIIIILQVNPFLGVDSFGSVIQTLIEFPNSIKQTNNNSLIIASLTLFIMLFTPKIVSKYIPAALIALVLVTYFSIFMNYNIPTIGEIPMGLPEIKLPIHFDILHLSTIITLAITLALLGSIDSLLTSLVADSMTKTKHNPNKELIGQGIGNTICSFFGAIPGAGATMRTVINIKSGGTTQLSGIIHSLTLLLIVLVLAPYASNIPLAVLSGILIKVGLDILDYKFLRILNKISKQDLLIMITVTLLTVFVDLIMAVGVGITFASIIAVYKVSKNTKIQTIYPKINTKFDIEVEDKSSKVIKIKGSLFFGTASILDKRTDKIKEKTKSIILDCLDIHVLDLSAVFILEDIIKKLNEKNIEIILLLKIRDKKKVLKIDQDNVFNNIKIFSKFEDAVNTIQENRHKTSTNRRI